MTWRSKAAWAYLFKDSEPIAAELWAIMGWEDTAFDILSLFANGEQGALYDPSDLSTLYQQRTGAAATTPSAVGGVVGTMLDLSGRGNHATAPSDAARPLLGREPEGGRRNLLLSTEAFESTNWAKFVGDLDGSGTTLREQNRELTNATVIQAMLFPLVTITLEIQEVGRNVITLWSGTSTAGDRVTYTFSTNQLTFPGTNISNLSAVDLGDGWRRIQFTAVNTTRFEIKLTDNGAFAYTGDSSKGLNCRNMQVEEGSISTPYQRVGASSLDATEAGKRDCYYLFHDLSDDKLQVTLPDLGSDATIATGDNDGVAILTGQTVGVGSYDLPDAKSKLFAHLLVERALTAQETTGVTAWMEERVSQP